MFLQCQDVAAFLQYKVSLLPVEQYQKVLKLVTKRVAASCYLLKDLCSR